MKHLIALTSLLFLMGCVSVSPRSVVHTTSIETSAVAVVESPALPADLAVAPSTPAPQSPLDQLVATLPDVAIPPPTLPGVSEYREFNNRDVECLAKALYFEAGGEVVTGMQAVGFVIVNRTQHKQYPKSICGVVYQRNKYGCQFSWVCDKKSDTPSSARLYARTREVALAVLSQQVDNPVGRAISFHNPNVRPSWARRMTYVRRIGGHFFYA